METEDAIPTEGDVPPIEAPVKAEAADDGEEEEESGEEEDDDDDDLQVVLNTEAIEKNEVLPQSSQFQSRTNYFRSPMVIQPGTKYSRTATATRQPMQHTQQIQSFVTPSVRILAALIDCFSTLELLPNLFLSELCTLACIYSRTLIQAKASV
jgi:hypothetical protein